MSFSLKYTFAALPRTQRGRRLCLKSDPKGKYMLYSSGKSVFIREIENPMITEAYTEHAVEVTAACFAPSAPYVCSGDVSGKVRIWFTDTEEHKLKAEYQPLGGAVKDICWSPDSKRIAAGGEGRGIFVTAFLVDTGTTIGKFQGLAKAVNAVDYKPTRPFRLVTASEDYSVGFFEGPPFQYKFSNKEHVNFVNVVRFSPNGERYISGSSDGKLFLYDGKTGQLISEVGSPAHKGGIYDVSWCSDNKHVLTASGDKTAKIFDVDGKTCTQEFTFGSDLNHQQLACVWAGDHLLTVELSGYINYLDKENPSQPKKVIKGHNKNITAFATSEDKKKIYTGSFDGLIYCWDVATGMCEPLAGKHHKNQVSKLAVDGTNLYSISMDDSLRVTSTETNEYSGNSVSFDGQPISLAVAKDGLAVVCCLDQTVVVLRNGKKVSSKKLEYQPSCASIHPNLTEIAVGNQSACELYIYTIDSDTVADEKMKITDGLSRELSVLQYSQDGAYLAAGDASKNVLVLDTTEYKVGKAGGCFHSSRITSLSWTSDSRHLASGSLDSNVIVWSVEKCSRVMQKGAHRNSTVAGVGWLSDNQLATTAADCLIKIWDIALPQ